MTTCQTQAHDLVAAWKADDRALGENDARHLKRVESPRPSIHRLNGTFECDDQPPQDPKMRNAAH